MKSQYFAYNSFRGSFDLTLDTHKRNKVGKLNKYSFQKCNKTSKQKNRHTGYYVHKHKQ